MAIVRTKLRELRNGKVQFISLVDRAATRIPFRVLKREESAMGIDLTRVFKRDRPVAPEVTAVVVFANPDAGVSERVRKSIAEAGFITNRVRKSDEGETVVYAQSSDPDGHMVRLSEQMIVVVKGLDAPKGIFSGTADDQTYYPGLDVATHILHNTVQDLIAKGDQAGCKAVDSYGTYLHLLSSLPAACFKADHAVNVLLQKAEAEKPKPEEKKEEVEKIEPVVTKEVHGLQPNGGSVTVEKTEEVVKVECATCKGSGKIRDGNMKCPDCDAKDGTKKEDPAIVQKTDLDQILSAIKEVDTRTQIQLSTITQKVEGVITEQGAHKKLLDGVVTKAETLESKLNTTVIASPNPADRVTQTETAKKVDEDPRTGTFDTAFIRRRGIR